MVSSNKASTIQTAPISPAIKKPVRKAPPPPTSATTTPSTTATTVNGNHAETPPISPHSDDQKAMKSPTMNSTTKPPTTGPKPPITSPKPDHIKKSMSVDEIHHPPVNESHQPPGGVKIPPKPPVRDSSLTNEVDESPRRHSSCNDNEAARAAVVKPVPKKRTLSVRT